MQLAYLAGSIKKPGRTAASETLMHLFATLIQRLIRLAVIFGITTMGWTSSLWAQGDEWERLNEQTLLLIRRGDYVQGVVVARQALFVAQRANQPESNLGTTLFNLAELYRAQGQLELAEETYLRTLAFWDDYLNPTHLFLAKILYPLAGLYHNQQKYPQAEPLLTRMLAIQEKALGAEHPDLIPTLHSLAKVYGNHHRNADAAPLLTRALAIQDRTLGPGHAESVATLQTLAILYVNEGQFALAEPLYLRMLAIQEKTFGLEHIEVAVALYQLAELYANQLRFMQAEPLYWRSLAVSEKALGADNPMATASLYGLVKLYTAIGQPAKAQPIYDRVLASLAKTIGPVDPSMLAFMLHLAPQDMSAGQLAQAEQAFGRWLAMQEKEHGPDAPALLGDLIKLAEIDRLQGKYPQAEGLFKRALAIEEKLLLGDHPGLAMLLNKLAELYRDQGQQAMALTMARRATSIHRRRSTAGSTRDSGDEAIREAAANQDGFFTHLDLLARNPGNEAADTVTTEAFEVVQLAQASGTASAIARMTARFASGDDALAGLVRRRQDVADRMARQEAQLLSAAGKPPQERRVVDERMLRDEVAAAEKSIVLVDAELTRRFPQYQELTRAQPVSIRRVQALLKPGEAMLLYGLSDARSFVWVVTSGGSDFLPLDVKLKDVAAQVALVRAEMDSDDDGRHRHVSIDALHALYQRLFAPAESRLAGIEHVMVVPSGPLQSLPLGMLVATPPAGIRVAADYARVDWLARRYAFSVLPAVGSLQALRQFAGAGSAKEPFAGFGDPSIGQEPAAGRGKRKGIDVRGIFRNAASTGGPASGQALAEVADVEFIRAQDGLPETASELRAMARSLKGDDKFIWLQGQATETQVKRLDLSRFRTIAFATHGVMAGQIRGTREAGLILTPPRQGSIDDDGYLSASEIARLRLNADWVLLSACNTAAADGTPGAEGFSGLAKAFLYAGARSLLVSHWSVESEATVRLTTAMLREYNANPAQGKATAHRKAMLALMDTPGYAHPLFWAPFVVVGEGGPN